MTILESYQARKTKRQKSEFINFYRNKLLKKGIKAKVEESGLFKSRNILIGDLNKAKIIFTAHYDTAPKKILPIPMIMTPNNKPLYLLIQIIPIALISLGLKYLFILLSLPFLLIPVLVLGLLFVGPTNHNTANDNTSGIIVLNEMLCRCGDNLDKAVFVLFDHEEIGMVGSYFFAKNHKQLIKDKLVINLDCVSDGDHIMVMKNKKILEKDDIDSLLYDSFSNVPAGKELYIEDKCDYPSDHIHFQNSIAIVSCNNSNILGKNISKMHTSKDKVFDKLNIEFITNSLLKMIENLS